MVVVDGYNASCSKERHEYAPPPPPFTVMTANTLASECLHLASRLRLGSSQPSGTCWDEATEEATEHVARYAAWVRAAKGVKGIKASKESSAAKGMEKALRTLKEAWRAGEIWSYGKVRWMLLKSQSSGKKYLIYFIHMMKEKKTPGNPGNMNLQMKRYSTKYRKIRNLVALSLQIHCHVWYGYEVSLMIWSCEVKIISPATGLSTPLAWEPSLRRTVGVHVFWILVWSSYSTSTNPVQIPSYHYQSKGSWIRGCWIGVFQTKTCPS